VGLLEVNAYDCGMLVGGADVVSSKFGGSLVCNLIVGSALFLSEIWERRN
jgi:hypothetical protein